MLLMHGLRRHQPARVVAVGTLLLGLGFGLMPFGRGPSYAALTVLVWSLGEILTLPMLMTLVASRSDPAAQGEYQGLVSLAFATAMATGPVLGTWAYARTGGDGVWHAVALMGLVLTLGFLCLRPLEPAEPGHRDGGLRAGGTP
jgi:predicted MFS family arabinose efflux permease